MFGDGHVITLHFGHVGPGRSLPVDAVIFVGLLGRSVHI